MHVHDAAAEALAEAVFQYARERFAMDPPPLDHPRSPEELLAAVGPTVTDEGLGAMEALQRFVDHLAPATISVDHPRFLAFVPAAPTEASVLFDLVVSASSLFGGSWLEGAGAVFAENQALRWLADLAGLPDGAGGVFVSGGTAGNLAALVAARDAHRRAHPEIADRRGTVVVGASVHSSVAHTARVMDIDVVVAPVDARDRLTGDAVRSVLAQIDLSTVFAVVATAGTTNAGIVDDLAGVADVCGERGIWFHVDGAYGAAALASPTMRPRFAGIERADSLTVDPHKWLFAPYDSCALLYRHPELARRAHTQHAEYLDVLTESGAWNPCDYAVHLSRRPRGLPFWFSLAAHGAAAYGRAVDATMAVARDSAERIRAAEHVELVVEPELSVVVFRRLGWSPVDYQAWSDRALADGLAFVVPSSWHGETVLRFCFVNPRTTLDDVDAILASLA